MTITVYTLPNCGQCTQTKRVMDRENLPYKTVDLTTNPEAMNKIKALGYQTAPVVITPTHHWSGFRLDNIHAEATRHRQSHAKTTISTKLREKTTQTLKDKPQKQTHTHHQKQPKL